MSKNLYYFFVKLRNEANHLFWYLEYQIKTLFLKILEKLNIAVHFKYNDIVRNTSEVPINDLKVIETDNFRATVRMRYIEDTVIDKDYYYRKKDNKRLYTISDESNIWTHLMFLLDDVQLRVDDKWYFPNAMPTFKAVCFEPPKKMFDESEEKRPLDVFTVEYDLDKLRSLKVQYSTGNLSYRDMSVVRICHYYSRACRELQEALENIKLSDLMRNKS